MIREPRCRLVDILVYLGLEMLRYGTDVFFYLFMGFIE
jgi:hypothetical protein